LWSSSVHTSDKDDPTTPRPSIASPVLIESTWRFGHEMNRMKRSNLSSFADARRGIKVIVYVPPGSTKEGYRADNPVMISAKLLGPRPNRDHLEAISVPVLNRTPILQCFSYTHWSQQLTSLNASGSSSSLCLSKVAILETM
jgi:hypothetical protein